MCSNSSRKRKLEKKIEQKRQELVYLVKEKGLSNSKVLSCSKELDNLIVQYQKNFFNNKGIINE